MIFLWGKMCLLYSLLGCPSKTKLLLHEVPEGSVLGPSMSPLFFCSSQTTTQRRSFCGELRLRRRNNELLCRKKLKINTQ